MNNVGLVWLWWVVSVIVRSSERGGGGGGGGQWRQVEACRTLKAGPVHPLGGKSPRAARCRGRQIKSSTCVFNYVNNQPGWKGGGWGVAPS